MGMGAVSALFIAQKMKSLYRRYFVDPYTLPGAFRDSPLFIRSTYRIIENCLLSEVHVEHSTVIINSGVIHKLHVNENSTVILNGGLIKGEIVIIGENSTVHLLRNSIVEANIFTVSPQQLQQKAGLLRGTVHIVVVSKENGTDRKLITVTSPRKHSVDFTPNASHRGMSPVPSIHDSLLNMDTVNERSNRMSAPNQIQAPMPSTRSSTNDYQNNDYNRYQGTPKYNQCLQFKMSLINELPLISISLFVCTTTSLQNAR